MWNMSWKTQNVREEAVKCKSSRMCLNLKDYTQNKKRHRYSSACVDHGNHRSNPYKRHTQTERQELKHTAKENHQTTKTERKGERMNREELHKAGKQVIQWQ